jgi:hypothetical protein
MEGESVNKNNVKTLSSILKLLENDYIDTWPDVIKTHKQACINALSNSIYTSKVVLSHGGVKTMANNAIASQKIDLFPDFEASNNELNSQKEPT